MANSFSSTNFLGNEEFLIDFSKVFNAFHSYFILNDEDENTFFLEPLNILMNITLKLTSESTNFSGIFIKNGCLKVLLDRILNNSQFSNENILKRISDTNSYSFRNNRVGVYSEYAILLANLARIENTEFENYKQTIKIQFQELINFLQSKKDDENINYSIIELKFLYFVILLCIDGDNNFYNSKTVPNDIFYGIETMFHSNIIGEKHDFPLDIETDKLLELLLFISYNKDNFVYLKRIIPLIFQIFQTDWPENVEFLALNCIYSFISIDEFKRVIINNQNFMEILNSNLKRKKHKKIEFLKRNILSELVNEKFIKENKQIVNQQPIFIQFHKDDEKIVNEIIDFLIEKTQLNNFLFLDFKCKY